MRRLASILAVLLTFGACTVPTNEQPVELSGTIPFGLLETTTTTTPTTVPQAVTKQVVVYFLDTRNATRLVGVSRDVAVGADVQEILANLFTVRPDGEEREAEAGLSSAIPESAMLLSASLADGSSQLVVDVRGLFGTEGGIQGENLRNALAQIVWTATEFDEVRQVAFRNNGTPVQALIDDGQIAEGPVSRAEYAQQS